MAANLTPAPGPHLAAAAIPETLCGRITDGKGGPIDVDDNLAVPIGSGLLLLALLRVFFPSLI